MPIPDLISAFDIFMIILKSKKCTEIEREDRPILIALKDAVAQLPIKINLLPAH